MCNMPPSGDRQIFLHLSYLSFVRSPSIKDGPRSDFSHMRLFGVRRRETHEKIIALLVTGLPILWMFSSIEAAAAFSCYNKQLVITNETVRKQRDCADDVIESIRKYVDFAKSGCTEYKSILSDISRIQTAANSSYTTAKTNDSWLSEQYQDASSEFGRRGKAYYRKELYFNWWNNYKDLLEKLGDLKDQLEEHGGVQQASGSAGNRSMEYNLSYHGELPCTKSSPSLSVSGIASVSKTLKPIPGIKVSPTPSPSPKKSVTKEDDDCRDPLMRAPRTFCKKEYKCMLWQEVP